MIVIHFHYLVFAYIIHIGLRPTVLNLDTFIYSFKQLALIYEIIEVNIILLSLASN